MTYTMEELLPVLKNALGQSHDIMRQVVIEGNIVVDATAGNGNDTALLAELVGEKGRVYSFDIQEKAINNTARKLRDRNLLERVTLINKGHQSMDSYVDNEVRAVVFNLGYLPGGDHSIGTRAVTTIQALEKAMEILEVGGVVIMVVYYGGDSGFEEKDCLMEYIKGVDCRKFSVMKTEFVNQVNCPPILVCMEKLCERVKIKAK